MLSPEISLQPNPDTVLLMESTTIQSATQEDIPTPSRELTRELQKPLEGGAYGPRVDGVPTM